LRALKGSSLARFVLHDESRFATSAWARAFGPDALNASGHLAAAHEVGEILVTDGPRHLRPDSVDKAFHGAVVDSANWTQVREKRRLNGDLLCWVSPPQQISAEWRCWVVGGMVVEISKYREDGQKALERETKPEVFASAQRLADRYLPAPCVVLDMAQVGARQVLIEFNPIHTSGWYAADVGKVLGAWLDWSLREWPARKASPRSRLSEA
jgi:hypothetical protein